MNQPNKPAPTPNKYARKHLKNQAAIAEIASYWDRFKQIEGEPPIPLSVGIREQINLDAKKRGIDVDSKIINAGLRAYTKRVSYIRVIAHGGARFDLEFNEAGQIEKEHQENALEILEQLKRKKEQRKKQKSPRK